MTGRALRWGAVAAAALVAFYVALLATSGGWAHLVDQARTEWWLVAPIVLAFGGQVALTVELRHRHRTHHLAATTGRRHRRLGGRDGGLLCSPPRRPRPAARCRRRRWVLFDWRIPFMAGGLAINLAAVTFAGRRLFHLTHQTTGSVSCAA